MDKNAAEEYKLQLARSLRLMAFTHSVDAHYGALRWPSRGRRDKDYCALANWIPLCLRPETEEEFCVLYYDRDWTIGL